MWAFFLALDCFFATCHSSILKWEKMERFQTRGKKLDRGNHNVRF